MKPKKKIYLSGPMTGYPNKNAMLFQEAETLLKRKYDVVNPHKIHGKKEKTYREYMTADIKALMGCDCIFMLPFWERSKGAFAERIVADALGLEIVEI